MSTLLRIAVAALLIGTAAGCARPAPPALLTPERLDRTAPASFRVAFETTKGSFVVEAHRNWAPLGVDRFYNLVRNGFYDGASFFRVLPGFVVQFGISADPAVSEVWRERRIPDDPVLGSNRRGTLSFATSGPDTRTTQVFINLVDNARLDARGFSPFARVIEGMHVVEQLYAGYGEGAPQGRGPVQNRILQEGAAYLETEFPLLDRITTARVLE